MAISGKEQLFEHFRWRYWRTDRPGKSKILEQICDIYGYHRKYAIRKLRSTKHVAPKAKRGPKPTYHPEKLLPHLKAIWFAMDQPCSKNLKASLPLWLPHYQATNTQFDKQEANKLLAMSAATIDRLLKPIRLKYKQRGLCGTRPGTLLKNQIPIKVDHWDVTKPGFMEADTVAHCGNSIAGNFVWSLTLTDIFNRKNDNAHVEQKNWTHVRQLFGYDRFERQQLVSKMNDLYGHEWSLLQNFFMANMKLSSKTKVNAKYRRKYHPPQTPYQRLFESRHLSNEKKNELKKLFQTLNPFHLKQEIERKLTSIFKLVKVTSNVRQRI